MRLFHLQPSEPDWGSGLAGSPVDASGSGMSGHMVWPGRSCSSRWLPSELEITQQAHETREERFDFRDVLDLILTGTEHTSKFFTVKLLFRRWNRLLFHPSETCDSGRDLGADMMCGSATC